MKAVLTTLLLVAMFFLQLSVANSQNLQIFDEKGNFIGDDKQSLKRQLIKLKEQGASDEEIEELANQLYNLPDKINRDIEKQTEQIRQSMLETFATNREDIMEEDRKLVKKFAKDFNKSFKRANLEKRGAMCEPYQYSCKFVYNQEQRAKKQESQEKMMQSQMVNSYTDSYFEYNFQICQNVKKSCEKYWQ